MVFCEENILYPELIELDVVDAVMMDDPDFMDQLMGTYDSSENLTGELDIDSDPDLGPLIDDSICGDSISMLDIEADDYIASYNDLTFDDGELIDKIMGMQPVI